MDNLLRTKWTDYRDSCYDDQYLHDPAPYDFEVDDVERAFYAGAIALFSLLGDHAHTDPDETVAAVKAELLAFADELKKRATT